MHSVNELVSIVIPVYNRQDRIRQCLQSCIEQTHRPLEIVVVDDGSKDDSGKVVQEFFEQNTSATGITMFYFHQENKGAPAARNLGISKATGSFIKLFDSDDLLPPSAIRDLLKAFDDTTDAVFGNGTKIDANSNPLWPITYEGFNKKEPISTVAGKSIVLGCLMFRRRCFETVRFNETIKVAQDRELCVNLLVHGFRFKHIPVVTYLHRVPDSYSISGKSWIDKDPNRYIHSFDTILSYVQTCDASIIRRSKQGLSRSLWIIGRRLLDWGRPAEAAIHFRHAIKINDGKIPRAGGYRFLATFVPVIFIERIRSILKPRTEHFRSR
jgi:glycosyltransferase involved in cell wall biosynthesis